MTTYPSGFTPPAIQSGYSQVLFDDFTETSLSSDLWALPAYSGESEAVTPGAFLANHLVLHGDSILNLQGYTDQAGIEADGNIPAGVGANNNWIAGAGVQTHSYGPNTRVLVAMRSDSVSGLTAIALCFGANNWPPEIDFVECNAPMTGFTASALYGSATPSRQQIQKSISGIALTNWMVFGVEWTPATITYYVQSTPSGALSVWNSFPNPDANPSDVHSLVQNMFIALQYQTGDPNIPAANPSLDAANPAQMQVDWIQISTANTEVDSGLSGFANWTP